MVTLKKNNQLTPNGKDGGWRIEALKLLNCSGAVVIPEGNPSRGIGLH